MAEEKGNEIGLGLIGFACGVGVLGMETSDDSKGSKLIFFWGIKINNKR